MICMKGTSKDKPVPGLVYGEPVVIRVVLTLAQSYCLRRCAPSERLQLRFLSGASEGHSQLPLTKIPQEKTNPNKGHPPPTHTHTDLPTPAERTGLFLVDSRLGLRGLSPPHWLSGCLSLSCLSSSLLAFLNHDCGEHGER